MSKAFSLMLNDIQGTKSFSKIKNDLFNSHEALKSDKRVAVKRIGNELQVHCEDHVGNHRYFPFHSEDLKGWLIMCQHLTDKTWFTKEMLMQLIYFMDEYLAD